MKEFYRNILRNEETILSVEFDDSGYIIVQGNKRGLEALADKLRLLSDDKNLDLNVLHLDATRKDKKGETNLVIERINL